MLGDVLAAWSFIKERADAFGEISAMFAVDGERIDGSDKIEVEVIRGRSKTEWFYRIKEIEGYVFLYMPLIPSVYVDYGTPEGQQNPDARIFRFVAHSMASFTAGGAGNVEVDFVVFGYRPRGFLNRAT